MITRDLKIGNWNGKPIVECIHSRIKFYSNSKGPPFFLRITRMITRDLKIGNWNGKPIVECIHSRIKFYSNSKGPPFFLRRAKGR